MTKEQIQKVILQHLKNNTLLFDIDKDIVLTEKTPITGVDGVLSSMQLVHFIVSLESLLNKDYKHNVVLASAKAFSATQSPFRSVDSLATFIFEAIKK